MCVLYMGEKHARSFFGGADCIHCEKFNICMVQSHLALFERSLCTPLLRSCGHRDGSETSVMGFAGWVGGDEACDRQSSHFYFPLHLLTKRNSWLVLSLMTLCTNTGTGRWWGWKNRLQAISPLSSVNLPKANGVAGQAGASLHTMVVLQAYQADLLNDLDYGKGLAPEVVKELRRATDVTLHATT